jgi:sodium-dependent phosphate cotransporter
MSVEASQRRPARVGVPPAVRGLFVLVCLYLFLVGISCLETGIAAAGAGLQQGLLDSVSHPISGLCAGLLVTVLVQSSSVSTSTIVGMVGAGTLPVALAVPMVMGANIGTTITSTLAALGSLRRTNEFRRAFAAATVHDFFNILGVVILLPVELATGVLRRSATFLTGYLRGTEVTTGPSGSNILRDAVGFPVSVLESVVGEHGAFVSVAFLLVGLACIFFALAFITKNMRQLMAGGVERVINRLIGDGGGLLGIAVGLGITVAVQSSSITTSILVPLVAAGVLTLRSAYPVTLGANVGTTVTALIASLAVARPEGLTIALVHLLFNAYALLLIYPLPQVRVVPVRLAEGLAELAVWRRRIVVIYVVGGFLVAPLLGVLLIR